MALQISISNAIGARAVAGGGGIDPDAQAFITAASITDPTQQSAINQLVVDLKGYNIWTKMKALYPFVGGTASAHKFNLKDPRDLDAAFRLVFNGGITHSSTGIKANGTNGYFDTFLNPSIEFSPTSGGSMFAYIRNNTTTGVDLGAFEYASGFNRFQITTRSPSNEIFAAALSDNLIQETNLDSRGFWGVTRPPSSSTYYVIKNTTSTSNTDTYREPNVKLFGFVLSFNSLPYAGTYSDHEFGFVCVADGLTTTQAANLYTAVQAFQVTLGRSIGTQTVSDADAQAFVTNAGIVDQVEANAVNNLVIGLKADGLWTKMKALYPFVGGSSTTMKYNLKNPLDTDAAFRLVFSGGWTFSSNGALPNGTNAYADTKLNISTQTTLNDIHLSFYSRNHSAVNSVDIGAATNSVTNYYLIQLTGATTFYIINESAYLTYPNFADTDTRGLYLGTRNGTVVKGWKNGTLRATKSPATTAARPNFNVYLGCFNQEGSPALYSARQLAFSSIGDGLTDTEAANFYNRVQTFNTALARQV